MEIKKIGPIRQMWYLVWYEAEAWFEWQDAQYWAAEFHPGWVHLANHGVHKETRAYYKEKILAAYRGEE